MTDSLIPSIDLASLELPDLVTATTRDDTLHFTYVIYSDRVCIHVWPVGVFPANTAARLRAGVRSMQDFVYELDYVPEMVSWYIELRGMPVKPTDAMIESLLGKILQA